MDVRFRAWDRQEKRMLSWEEITDPKNSRLQEILTDTTGRFDVMLQSDVRDSNGVLLHRGDLVEMEWTLNAGSWEEHRHTDWDIPVEFEKGCFLVGDFWLIEFLQDKTKRITVTGHFYQSEDE